MVTPINRICRLIGSIILPLLTLFLLFCSRPERGTITAPKQERQEEQPRTGAGQGRGNDYNPPVRLLFPGDERQNQRDEAARLRDRLSDVLESIGMSKIGGPLFEEDIDGPSEEGAPQQPTTEYQDPYIAERCGPFVLTTWGALWRVDAQGGQCNA